MDKLKKMTSYRLFWPIVCLALVLLFNLIKSPSFFEISIKNGVLYGYLVDIFNRSSELIILAVGMTLCVASSARTDISDIYCKNIKKVLKYCYNFEKTLALV